MSVAVSSSLQRDRIMQFALLELNAALITLGAFSIQFNNVQLEGTDKMPVPYFPSVTAASKDWNGSTGYEFDDAYTQQSKDVTIDKRKYQPFSYTSKDLARQPHLNVEQIGRQIGRKLAEDVIQDILGSVTLANFGAAVFTGASSLFDFAQVNETVGTACDVAKWRKAGRSLILASAYYRNLVTDLSDASAYMSDNPAKMGVLENVAGFDVYNETTIPANGQNLVGFACLPSAILIGFSPVKPADEGKVVNYQTLTDDNGLTIEYREWFDADTDKLKRVFECNYGFGVGEAAALKRIVSA